MADHRGVSRARLDQARGDRRPRHGHEARLGPERVALLLTALALGAAGCGAGAGDETATTAQTGGSENGVVSYVNDGDTLQLRDGRRIRLLQIDAPELHGDCFGKAALSALRRLTPKGTRITLVRDPGLDQKDAYGRLLRYVVSAGRNVNLELVREGAASPYFFRKQRGRYAGALLDAVEEARAEKRGYWAACPRAELNTGIGSITGPA